MTLMAAPALDIFSLEGRVALVTGASSGIGRRMALAFAGVGADVVLVARRRGVLEVAAREIEEATARHVHCIDVDLAGLTAFEALAALASKPFGAPDILVNAAGVNYREPWDALTRDGHEPAFDLTDSRPELLLQVVESCLLAKFCPLVLRNYPTKAAKSATTAVMIT